MRVRIVALVLIPLVSLFGLWAFTVLTVSDDVGRLQHAEDSFRQFARPVDALATGIQNERHDAVAYLAAPSSKAAQDRLQGTRAATDRLADAVSDARGDRRTLDRSQQGSFAAVIRALDELPAVRAQVADTSLTWDEAMEKYSALVAPMSVFEDSFTALQSDRLAQRAAVHRELVRARENLAQEEAALAGLQATQDPSEAQFRLLDSAVEANRLLFKIYLPQLQRPDRTAYDQILRGPGWQELGAFENRFLSEDHGPKPEVAGTGPWSDVARSVVSDLTHADDAMASSIAGDAKQQAEGLVRRGAIGTAVGLAAIILSVYLTSRMSRSLVRELNALRNAAQEMAHTRLPDVMRRLRKGEEVDEAVAAPPLDFGAHEIGQVGRALSVVQRTAVEAAVEQSELRRAASRIFVNLARRSQSLLHRQLSLLDGMERRAQEPDALADLFRLDHLTTRMRRHAEGLIILSGGAPGRAWRRPVPLIDVVRAAIAEVEDYTRIVLHPLPEIALLGQAVGDVAHLVAELVENATAFSPPHTRVTVGAELVAHGCVLEIDDRGLGMGTSGLADAHQRLSDSDEFDLANTDRLGLFVVNRLARRHGINVSLRASPYGGTCAIVLLPAALLTESGTPHPAGKVKRPVAGDADPDDAQQMTLAAALRLRRTLDGAPTGPVPAEPAAASTAATAPAAAAEERPEPWPETAKPAAGGRAESTARGLPHRVRQANIARQLAVPPGVPVDAGSPVTASREHTAAGARALFGSFQRRAALGRGPEDPAPPSDSPALPHDPADQADITARQNPLGDRP
ncbi:nitrate- and nitrite sensing domain-containing protein [Streptomyces fildesensis]|uniref:histidine kinase n=1 Tax=Streptomyces fildesensis TaxID=375757 RepID=A0ABW8C516_9ACTN